MSNLSIPHTPPSYHDNNNNNNLNNSNKPLKRRKYIRDLSCMSIDSLVGAGMYGSVYKATDKEKGDKVALKYIKMNKESEGFPVTAIREIKLLKAMNNENVIRLYDVITFQKREDSENQFNFDDGAVFMVFEYMEFDLSGLLTCKQMTFSPSHIRCYAKQLFSGLHYMHRNHILHRDIKGANILIGRDNKLKIADWGLARSFYSETQKLTNNVVTIWYRCPELLLETTRYGPPIDIWSAGCLFAEMFSHGYPILPADPSTPIRQLELIYQLCGTPTGETEERLKKCEGWDKYQFSTTYPNRIRERFSSWPDNAIDLLEKLLCLHPEKRINASAVLDHPYFWSDGPTLSPEMLPRISYRIEGTHEYEVQQKRMEDVSKRQQPPQQIQQSTTGRGNANGNGNSSNYHGGGGRGHNHNHGHSHNHNHGHNQGHNHNHSNAPPPPSNASGRGRSRYRVVTRPNQQGNDNSTTATTTATTNNNIIAAPPEVPNTVSSSSDSIVPQHESAFRKLGS